MWTAAIGSSKNAKLIDKYDYLTGKEIKPSDQVLVCEKRKIEYTLLSQEFTIQTRAHLKQDNKPLHWKPSAIANVKKIFKKI